MAPRLWARVQDVECGYIDQAVARILKLVKEVQSDKLNISTQWLRGDYGPCSKLKVAQNLLLL